MSYHASYHDICALTHICADCDIYTSDSPTKQGWRKEVLQADLGNTGQCCAEDVRSYKFTSLDAKEDMTPTQSQLQAAESLVDALDLTQGAALFWCVVHLFVPPDSVAADDVAGCSQGVCSCIG